MSPKGLTPRTFKDWGAVKQGLILHGLKSGPDAALFKSICQSATLWLEDLLNGTKPASSVLPNFVDAVYNELVNHFSLRSALTFDDPVMDVVGQFPKNPIAYQLGRFNSCPTAEDLKCLMKDTYINGEVMRSFLGISWELLDEPDSIDIQDPEWLTSFEMEFRKGEKPTIPEFPDTVKQVFVPIHHTKQEHWTLVVIDLARKQMDHYDSLKKKNGRNVFKRLDEVNMLENYPEFSRVEVGCPQQPNLVDCGVYLMAAVHDLARGKEIINHPDTNWWRKWIAEMIIEAYWASWGDVCRDSLGVEK